MSEHTEKNIYPPYYPASQLGALMAALLFKNTEKLHTINQDAPTVARNELITMFAQLLQNPELTPDERAVVETELERVRTTHTLSTMEPLTDR